MNLQLPWIAVICLLLGISCGQGKQKPVSSQSLEKITFDLNQFDEQGLYGPPDGLRAMDYEFCIPATTALVDEVRCIDSTLAVLEQARGRIGCSDSQYLCIGTTHQAHFRQVLARLAALEYVKRIDPCYYE